MSIHQLPDFARMRDLEARVRAYSDEEVADFLCTPDGEWLFTSPDLRHHLAHDVSFRLIKVMTAGMPPGAVFDLMGFGPGKGEP